MTFNKDEIQLDSGDCVLYGKCYNLQISERIAILIRNNKTCIRTDLTHAIERNYFEQDFEIIYDTKK